MGSLGLTCQSQPLLPLEAVPPIAVIRPSDVNRWAGIQSQSMERICIVIVSEYSVTFMSLRVLLLILPWPFFTAMFSTCWGCYDFEAAVAHEVGHLLGFGHPDLAPWEHLPE